MAWGRAPNRTRPLMIYCAAKAAWSTAITHPKTRCTKGDPCFEITSMLSRVTRFSPMITSKARENDALLSPVAGSNSHEPGNGRDAGSSDQDRNGQGKGGQLPGMAETDQRLAGWARALLPAVA